MRGRNGKVAFNRALSPEDEWAKIEPKHFTAEPAKITKAHQLSTAGAQQRWAKMLRPGHVSSPAVPLDMGISLRALRPLRFKWNFWVENAQRAR